MDFPQAIAIFISSELAAAVVHTLMTVSPGLQTSINVVLICINKCAWINGIFDQRLDGLLLHVREQIDHDLTATLNHAKDRWSFLNVALTEPKSPCELHKIRLTRHQAAARACRSSSL